MLLRVQILYDVWFVIFLCYHKTIKTMMTFNDMFSTVLLVIDAAMLSFVDGVNCMNSNELP
jgi:hypothetical protein